VRTWFGTKCGEEHDKLLRRGLDAFWKDLRGRRTVPVPGRRAEYAVTSSRVPLPSVTSAPWQSFSARQQGLPLPQALHEGVPPHLETPMRAWVYRALQGGGHQIVALRLELQIDYEWARGDGPRFLAEALHAEVLLDVIDAILGAGGPWAPLLPGDLPGMNSNHAGVIQLREDLITMLAEGRSAYRVNDAGDGLTTRVADASTKVFQTAAAAARQAANTGSAANLLRTAWDSLYDLHPDPPKAYRSAVAAVEAAAHAIIQPNHASATLGSMLRHLRSQPQRFALAIPGPAGTGDITPLISMIELVWTGQTSRHGGQAPTRMETREEAEMAVHLAVTLVHWFTTGAVQAKP